MLIKVKFLLQSRFWRKNRARGFMVGDFCSGVDLNRNFDIFWGTASSNNVCSDTFHGRGPFSEPETVIIRDILAEYGSRIELYLDIHSFGRMILYGYGNGILPPNALLVNFLGVRMAQAIDAIKWPENRILISLETLSTSFMRHLVVLEIMLWVWEHLLAILLNYRRIGIIRTQCKVS